MSKCDIWPEFECQNRISNVKMRYSARIRMSKNEKQTNFTFNRKSKKKKKKKKQLHLAYHFDDSILIEGASDVFFIFMPFFDEIPLSKQNGPKWDATFCDITSGTILFAYVP